MKTKLTQEFIQTQLRCPEGRPRIEFVDADCPGMYVLVSAVSPGVGSYFLRYKNTAGTTCHQKLGRTTDIGLADARKAARTLRAEISLGQRDPRAEAKARKSVPTFAEFFEEDYLKFAKAMKRSWKSDDAIFRTRLKARFGGQRLDAIRRADVIDFHTSLLKEVKPATADHYAKCVRRVLNHAVELEIISKNPCARFRLFNPDNRVFRHLTDEELGRLLAALRDMENRPVANMATWLLATSARLSEGLSARWQDVDRANRRWYIPAAASKSKRGRWVPLSDTAMGVLDRLTTEGRYEHLFVNEKTKKPYTSFMRVWRRVRAKAGLPHLRIHDLRGTGLSLMANRGVSPMVLKEIAGHADVRITASTYTRMADATLLDAVQIGSRALQAAAPKPTEQQPAPAARPEAANAPVADDGAAGEAGQRAA